MRFLSSILCAVALVGSLGLSVAAQPAQSNSPLITYNARFHPVVARNGMVVAQERLAARAGRDIMKAGGNAVDAAVATGFALAVTHPQAGNLGGGGFMLIHLPDEGRTVAIDYREMAPAAAYRDLFLNEDGDVDNAKARFSLASSGVPGTVRGLLQAHRTYGKLPLKTVMAPAIALARDGFELDWALAESLARYQKRMTGDPAASVFFKPDGTAYEAGERLVQADLARTLHAISEHGDSVFYEGWIADRIVETMDAGDGLITHEDLKGYVAKAREALSAEFMGYEIVTMPPPSSGGVHVLQMLNVLSGYDLRAMGHNSAAYIHHLTEAMKYAYADRSLYLGDPDYVVVPVETLMSDAYGDEVRSRINSDRATPSTEIGPTPGLADESRDTTHFSVMDADGMMVSNTYTLNFTYGNGKMVKGAGFLLNNEMDDFSAKPGVPNAFGLLGGEANAIEPGKRPLSSMTPVIVLKDGKPHLVTGSPGGSRIITTVMQVVLNATVFDMNPMQAVAMPRIHHQWYPDKLFVEPGFPADSRRLLSAMGHNIRLDLQDGFDRVMGSAQTIGVHKNGHKLGAADPRRPGSEAAGY